MSLGKEIIQGMKEALADAQGKDIGDRKTTILIPREVDVRAIRTRLNLTQQQFASRFGFSLGAVRHWEQGRRQPDGPVRAYLKVIERNPEAVEEALGT